MLHSLISHIWCLLGALLGGILIGYGLRGMRSRRDHEMHEADFQNRLGIAQRETDELVQRLRGSQERVNFLEPLQNKLTDRDRDIEALNVEIERLRSLPPRIVEKVVEKIVDRPVEKIVTIEKPVTVEKIVEKIVDRPVEKIVTKIDDTLVNQLRGQLGGLEVELTRMRNLPPKIVEKMVEKIVDRPVEKIVEVEKIVTKIDDTLVNQLRGQIGGFEAEITRLKNLPPKIVEKIVDRPVEKIVEKIVDRPVEKIVTVEKVVEKIVDRPVEKFVEKFVDRPVEKIVTKIDDTLVNQLRGQISGFESELTRLKNLPPKVVEKIVDRPVEKIVEKIVDRPVEKIVTKIDDTLVNQLRGQIGGFEAEITRLKNLPPKVVEKIVDRPVEKIVEKIVDRPVEKIVTVEKVVEKFVDRPVEKIVTKIDDTLVNQLRGQISGFEAEITRLRNLPPRVVEKIVDRPVDRIVEKFIDRPVDRIVEKIVEVEKVVRVAAPRRAPAPRKAVVRRAVAAPKVTKPRRRVKDDLKLIYGVGPKLEKFLNRRGITLFRQVAAWERKDIDRFEADLPEFKGRIRREGWVASAKAEHRKKYGREP